MSESTAAERAWEAWLPIGTSVPSHERFTTDRASFIAGHASRDAEIAALKAAQVPITCSERMPEVGVWVLCWSPRWDWQRARLVNDIQWNLLGIGTTESPGVRPYKPGITHWFPLPAPPTVEDAQPV